MPDLSPEERALVAEILQREYMDLREEIVKTENTDYKAQLKKREAMLESVIAKVAA